MGIISVIIKGIFTVFGLFILFVIIAILLTWLAIFLLMRKVRNRVEELKRQNNSDMRKEECIDEVIIDVKLKEEENAYMNNK